MAPRGCARQASVERALYDELKRYLVPLYGIDFDPNQIKVPRSTVLGITYAAQIAPSFKAC